MKHLLGSSIFLLAVSLAHATDTAYSPPLGGMTITVPAGQTRAVTLPLLPSVYGSGAVIGKIAAVGPNYIDIQAANLSPGAFSNSAIPYFLRITSGAAAGRVIPVNATANTASRLNLTNDSLALDSVAGPSVGDSYELVLADTLAGVFGSTTLQGGPDYLSADNVQIWGNTSWVTYYYNTTRSRWERSTDTAASAARDNTLLRQDKGFMIVRRAATPLNFYFTGRVPSVGPRHVHLSPGVTLFSHGLPVATTIGSLGLQNRISNWRGSTSGTTALTDADLIQIWGNTSWVSYYYDTGKGSWQRSTDTGASASRDSVSLAPGQAFMIRRLDSSANPNENIIPVALPYSIAL